MAFVSEAILRIKTEHKNPYFLIAGNLNKFDPSTIYDDYDDIDLLPSPPTRGAAVLDVLISNFNET